MSRYASRTDVSVEKSRAEIERVLTRYGADHFAYVLSPMNAVIGFKVNGREIRLTLRWSYTMTFDPSPVVEQKCSDPYRKKETAS